MPTFKLLYLIPFTVLFFLPMWYVFQLGKKTGYAFMIPTLTRIKIREIIAYFLMVALFFSIAISFVMDGYIKSHMLFILSLGIFPGSFVSWACGFNTGRQFKYVEVHTKVIQESYGQS